MKIIYFATMLFVLSTSSAYAYLDPGTGSMLLQVLAAGAIGAGLFWRRGINFIKSLFNKGASSKNDDEE